MTDRTTIASGICNACGLCAEVCPNRIMVRAGRNPVLVREDRLPLCIRCGQCMAVCPTRAIVVDGLSYDRDFFPLPEGPVGEMPFLKMITSRRAVRVFKDQPVPREVLEKVVQAIAFAPPGFPPLKTELIIVEDTSVVRRALPEMIRVYDGLVKAMDNPIGRLIVRLKTGRETFGTLKRHLVPVLGSRLPDLKQGTEDTLTRRAPAMIVFHASPDAENYEEDIHIAVTYGFLAAHALGLGGSAMSIIPPAIQRSPVLRELFGIPDSNVVVGSIILGYPDVRYRRGIRRDLRSVTWI